MAIFPPVHRNAAKLAFIKVFQESIDSLFNIKYRYEQSLNHGKYHSEHHSNPMMSDRHSLGTVRYSLGTVWVQYWVQSTGACHVCTSCIAFIPQPPSTSSGQASPSSGRRGEEPFKVSLPKLGYPLRKSRQTFCLTTFLGLLRIPVFESRNAGFSEICVIDSKIRREI
jgi:hypothetical protein